MPTTTDHRAPEHEAPKRGLFSARTSAIAIVVASVATLAVVFVILTADSDAPLQVYSVPAQTDSGSQQIPAPVAPTLAPAASDPTAVQASPAPARPIPTVNPAPSPAAPTAAAQTTALKSDSLGYVDSAARCDTDQRAAAIARTERAAVVVCEDSDGSLEYQGVRLHDGATLQLDDVRPMAVGFEARNGATTYRLSPTELVVISGETLQSRDPIVEYRADEG
ncbi:hypothetical protein C6A87_021330 [Mycobacterium sp. ITM-2016-00317]|uniref:hypothetical protein n=1 Tax=Mycobacterium sp. ITM-2016-00317 TaxID=2099694 RepID=UPI00287FF311|nr:hypothetical protein [Mycobacterium sp. ITM-2016-00317]WNG86376.1 hypothetical protein C6A87_021330 [Mycobacterium sp. ITM-2016-00317]